MVCCLNAVGALSTSSKKAVYQDKISLESADRILGGLGNKYEEPFAELQVM